MPEYISPPEPERMTDRLSDSQEERQIAAGQLLDGLRYHIRLMEWAHKNKHQQNDRQKHDYHSQLARYEAGLVRFLIEHKNDRPYLEQFWADCEKKCLTPRNRNLFRETRRGALRQAAVYQLFEQAGLPLAEVTPEQDVTQAADFFLPNGDIVQVKGLDYGREAFIWSTDQPMPAAFNSQPDLQQLGQEAQKFKRIIERQKIPSSAYMVVIPQSYFDEVTSAPKSRGVTEFKQKLIQCGLLPETHKEAA